MLPTKSPYLLSQILYQLLSIQCTISNYLYLLHFPNYNDHQIRKHCYFLLSTPYHNINSKALTLQNKTQQLCIQDNQINKYCHNQVMNFLKKITKKEILQKVVQIASIPIITKVKNNPQQRTDKNIQENTGILRNNKQSEAQVADQNLQINDYQLAQRFILSLSENSKIIRKEEIKKKTKKAVFSELQIDPIFLQHCLFIQLFEMELQFASSQRYERTETLHNYLNQVNKTIKKILSTQNMKILEVFDVVRRYQEKITKILTKIKLMREAIKKTKIQKELKIKEIISNKLIIKQKLALLTKIKQKNDITVVKPENIEQVYYTQRSRHKLYNRIKTVKIENSSYMKALRSQILSISINNVKILEQNLRKWINEGQKLRNKNIEKIFICLYFVKTENIYKENKIRVELHKVDRDKLIKQIQTVKTWKDYQYIRDPGMKGKIGAFLDSLITQVRNLNS